MRLVPERVDLQAVIMTAMVDDRRRLGDRAADTGAPTRADLPVPSQAAAGRRLTTHILNTPNCGEGGIGAFSDAAIPSASALRVSTGSSTPSSHRRALE